MPGPNDIERSVALLARDYAERGRQSLFLNVAHSVGLGRDADLCTLQNSLEHPFASLRASYALYAFSRRGKDRDRLTKAALAALDRFAAPEQWDSLVSGPNAQPLWDAFVAEMSHDGRVFRDEQLIGPVAGLLELTQEIRPLSLHEWLKSHWQASGRVHAAFERMVDIRGVGPKIASHVLRDAVLIWDAESMILPIDRPLLLPVDKWVRAFGDWALYSNEPRDHADWLVAGQVSKLVRQSGHGIAAFNIGLSTFGSRVSPTLEDFSKTLLMHVQELGDAV